MVERWVEDTFFVFNHDQVIDVDDVRLMNLYERLGAFNNLVGGDVFTQGDRRSRMIQVSLPLFPGGIVFEETDVFRA